MANCDFDWQIDEYMVYCQSRPLRPKTMNSYEQTLRLFQRWCKDSMGIDSVDKVTDSVIRRYKSLLAHFGFELKEVEGKRKGQYYKVEFKHNSYDTAPNNDLDDEE